MTTGYDEQYVSIWIDFNDDNVFSSDELILVDELVGDDAAGNYPLVTNVTIPSDAALGEHRLS